MVWPAVIGAAAAIAGGVLGNRAAAGEASANRDFQADQYARRYQITMSDMKTAGLNPMLAYSQGVGSSPSGSMAAQGDLGGSSAGALIAQASLRKASAKQQNTQAAVNISSAKNLNQDTILKKQQTRETSARTTKAIQETASEFQRGIHIASQNQLTQSQNRRVDSEISALAARTSITKDQQRLLKLEIERMVKTGSGPVGKTIDDIMKSIPSSAKGLKAWLDKQITFTRTK